MISMYGYPLLTKRLSVLQCKDIRILMYGYPYLNVRIAVSEFTDSHISMYGQPFLNVRIAVSKCTDSHISRNGIRTITNSLKSPTVKLKVINQRIVDKNIIGAPKILNNEIAHLSNIAITILDFSLLYLEKFLIFILFNSFQVSVLCFFT